MLYQGKRTNGRLSLEGVVLYREPIAWWQYVALGVPMFAWGLFIFAIVSPPIETFIIDRWFAWLPDWFFLFGLMDNLAEYTQTALLITWGANILFNGIGAPIIEEFYFRGYLLPRISRLGWWAPLVNVVLFSLYHFFTPWQNPARILALPAWVYAVQWKKNIYLGMAVHLAANILGALAVLPVILGLA
jgi:membrane protease YdiL (CAAX protease family)